MRILLGVECLRPGGAQVFVLRLAKALEAGGHSVFIFINFKDYQSQEMIEEIHPAAKIFFPEIPYFLDWVIRKTDKVLYYANIDIQIREWFVRRSIRKQVTALKPEVVHSHMFKSDYSFSKALEKVTIPHAITMHGCYENFWHSAVNKTGEVLHNYNQKMIETLGRVDGIAYLTQKNIDKAKLVYGNFDSIYKEKIYNGFPETSYKPKDISSAQNEPLVFGMVARGIPEKGWETAIQAFELLTNEGFDLRLILVGSSDHLDFLQNKYSHLNNIEFAGYIKNPLEYIEKFDVGILPSTFGSESLPNAVVEYLYCGKAVVASDIGDVREMLLAGDKTSGRLVSIRENKVSSQDLAQEMKHYILHKEDLDEHKKNAKLAFSKFEMQTCVKRYEHFDQQTIAKYNGEEA